MHYMKMVSCWYTSSVGFSYTYMTLPIETIVRKATVRGRRRYHRFFGAGNDMDHRMLQFSMRIAFERMWRRTGRTDPKMPEIRRVQKLHLMRGFDRVVDYEYIDETVISWCKCFGFV